MHDTSINTSMRHIENTLIATDPGKERYDATLKELSLIASSSHASFDGAFAYHS